MLKRIKRKKLFNRFLDFTPVLSCESKNRGYARNDCCVTCGYGRNDSIIAELMKCCYSSIVLSSHKAAELINGECYHIS